MMGLFTVIYDTIGGIKAVVYSDVIQTFILVLGILMCIWVAAETIGGFSVMFDTLPNPLFLLGQPLVEQRVLLFLGGDCLL